jgi:DNA-binding beta-propeller fold protein YncE
MIAGLGLEVRLTPPVEAALAALGRTEDLCFSPSNGLLAITGFNRKSVLFLRVSISSPEDEPSVVIDGCVEVNAHRLSFPHGLAFIDDDTIAVASRGGGVSVLPVPPSTFRGGSITAEALWHFPGGRFRWMRSPGSVAVCHEPGGRIGLLICNNYSHRVSRLVLEREPSFRTTRREVYLRKGLAIPDGIAVSHDGRWIAISCHATHDVRLFRRDKIDGPKTAAAGRLVEAGYPHGIQFTPDDRYLLVADAGSLMVRAYDRGEGWDGEHASVHAVEVLDQATFLRGRQNPEEGGPKGIGIDRTGQVVAITNEEQPLAFFSLRSFLPPG